MGQHHYAYPTVIEIRPVAPRVLPGRPTTGDRYFRAPADSDASVIGAASQNRQSDQDVW